MRGRGRPRGERIRHRGAEEQQFRISDCEFWIEFGEGLDGELRVQELQESEGRRANRTPNPKLRTPPNGELRTVNPLRLMDKALEGFLIFFAGFCDYLWRQTWCRWSSIPIERFQVIPDKLFVVAYRA